MLACIAVTTRARAINAVPIEFLPTTSPFPQAGCSVRASTRLRSGATVDQTLIKRILPGVFRQACATGSPLSAIVDSMVALLRPVHELLQEIDSYVDPQRTPPQFVNFLVQWVDLGVLLESVFEGRVLPAAQFPTGEE